MEAQQLQKFIDEISQAKSLAELESARLVLLGKKGVITEGFSKLKELSGDEKKALAESLNKARD